MRLLHSQESKAKLPAEVLTIAIRVKFLRPLQRQDRFNVFKRKLKTRLYTEAFN